VTAHVHITVRASAQIVKHEEEEIIEEWSIPTNEMPDEWEYMTDEERAKWVRSAERSKYWINAYKVLTPVVVSATETGVVRTTVSVKGEKWF